MRATLLLIVALACLLGGSSTSLGEPPNKMELTPEEAVYLERMQKGLKEAEMPVSFHGKVIDQHGNPVEGATVTFHLRHYDPNYDPKDPKYKEAFPFFGQKPLSVITGKDGLFSLENERGLELLLSNISLKGYAFDVSEKVRHHPYDFSRDHLNRHEPDKTKPVSFVLRKRGEATFILEHK